MEQVYGEGYQRARAAALERSPVCQLCRCRPAMETHHWAQVYPSDSSVEPEDLTALCLSCHAVATTIRPYYRNRGKPDQIRRALERAGLHAGETETEAQQLQRVYGEGHRARCRFCGHYMAVYAWAPAAYSSDDNSGPNGLTPLCSHCHDIAMRLQRHCSDAAKLLQVLKQQNEIQQRKPYALMSEFNASLRILGAEGYSLRSLGRLQSRSKRGKPPTR